MPFTPYVRALQKEALKRKKDKHWFYYFLGAADVFDYLNKQIKEHGIKTTKSRKKRL